MGTARDPATILFDGYCGFCRWSVDKLLLWDRRGRLRALEIQSDEGRRLLEAAGVPEGEWLGSWHLALSTDSLYSAGEAAAPLLELLPAGKPLATVLRRFPHPTEVAYRWVASNRDIAARLLRIDPICKIPPDARGQPPSR